MQLAGDGTACEEVLASTQQRLLRDGIVDHLISALISNLQTASGREPSADDPHATGATLSASGLQEQV